MNYPERDWRRVKPPVTGELLRDAVNAVMCNVLACKDAVELRLALSATIQSTIEDAAEAEREACAALAETHLTAGQGEFKLTPTPGEIARAIRARGTP